jgi:hypothetical protein
MIRTTCITFAAAFACCDLAAQSNSLGPGYNGALYEISQATAWGRRGPLYPNGEVGVSFQNGLCNPGSMDLAWFAADNNPPGTQMSEDHPMFGFMVAKEQNGRLVQISDWSYCKHAFLSLNDPGTCGTCTNQTATETMYVGCSDVYSPSNNGSRTYLGPPSEIDPWLGTWNHVGSFFDVGYPANGAPNDGIKGSINPGSDVVMNRVTIKETDLVGVTAGLYFQIHVIHKGEPVANRGNNTMSRPFVMTWGGSNWNATTLGMPTFGSILTRWPGATLSTAQNGNDDGRFVVAVNVTGPTNGIWHYEYAVHNLDNKAGSAAFRVPVCPTGNVTNIGFRDIDQNALNNWVGTNTGTEIVWSAPAGNPQNWNTLFNFWFDSDVAPVAGNISIDKADLTYPGALTVAVPTSVPGYQPVIYLGPGCGVPECNLYPEGFPTTGNPTFGIRAVSDPGLPVLLFFSLPGFTFPIAPGCNVMIDPFACGDFGLGVTDAAGITTFTTPVDPTWPECAFQAATFVINPPVAGIVGLSSGIVVRYNQLGCD